ncbi:hypothetical protein KKG66_06815 [bacterium]|nr:hypothetical protein [bacterium]
MRYRMFLLLGLLAAGMTVMALPASAYIVTNSYNLERATIYGYVEYVENQVAYIQIDNGDQIAVELGPESFWNAHRYYLTRGEYVEMLVWYDPADRYTTAYFASEIWGPGYHYRITNDEGIPYWVIFADDYYYSLGYRASCVSFMLWYDCPPVYFIYLVLPPPPPRTYYCYYGPHWRTHHYDWHYGPRYRRDGSYWHDGQGYERRGHRSTGHAGNDTDRGGDITGTNRSVSYSDTYKRPVAPVTPPVVKPSTVPVLKSTQRTQTATSRKSESLLKKSQFKSVTSVATSARKVTSSKSVAQERQLQPQSKVQSRKEVGTSKVVRQVQRDNNSAKNNQTSRTIKVEKRTVVDSQAKHVSK